MTLALSTAFLASGLTVLFTVPVSAGQVDGGLGRWLMFIGAVAGLALIAAGLVLLVRARDAEMRHRDRIRQVVAFQHELRWHMSEIDWTEFKQVLAGNGPCNRDRLAARRKAHEEGAWVREAAAAYAAKRESRRTAQAAE